MPTLSDTQGGTVTVTSGTIASANSWVTIIPGPPVEIHGEPKQVSAWYGDIVFQGGTNPALIRNSFNFIGNTMNPTATPGQWVLFTVLFPAGAVVTFRYSPTDQVQFALVSRVTEPTRERFTFATTPGAPAFGITVHLEFFYTTP